MDGTEHEGGTPGRVCPQCGSPLPEGLEICPRCTFEATLESLDQGIGRFESLSELGRGGEALVFRARDPEREREVALKVQLSPASTTQTSRV